jgi:hypothetical protein
VGALAASRPVPAVSVVIPTYRRSKLVKRAVLSVLAQTEPDFELIVIDGGDDGTREALTGLDDRLRYHSEPNCGVARARNAALDLARAPVVAFLDSDNVWLPHHLASVTRALARHPGAVLATTCPQFHMTGREPPEEARLIDALPRLLLTNYVGFISCVAVRREALTKIGGFDEALGVGEDRDLYLRLAQLGPFSVVRHRSIVRQFTRGGLEDRGRDSGEYLRAWTRSTARAVEDFRSAPRSDAPELVRRGEAIVQVLQALQALRERDQATAAASLVRACRMMPELSQNPELVFGRVKWSAIDRAELRSLFATTAALWPDPASDTALFMRAYAALLAIRAGKLRAAAALVAHRPLLLHAGFALRTLPYASRLLRVWFLRNMRRGRESADLDSGSNVSHDHGPHSDDRRIANLEVIADDGGHPD